MSIPPVWSHGSIPSTHQECCRGGVPVMVDTIEKSGNTFVVMKCGSCGQEQHVPIRKRNV